MYLSYRTPQSPQITLYTTTYPERCDLEMVTLCNVSTHRCKFYCKYLSLEIHVIMSLFITFTAYLKNNSVIIIMYNYEQIITDVLTYQSRNNDNNYTVIRGYSPSKNVSSVIDVTKCCSC